MKQKRPPQLEAPSLFHTAVVIPTRRRAHLFLHHADGFLENRGPVPKDQLASALGELPRPSLVTLAGNRRSATNLRDQLLDFTDLFVVRESWLRHLPPEDLQGRARTTRRVVLAHLLDPIAFYLQNENPADYDPFEEDPRPIPDDIPF